MTMNHFFCTATQCKTAPSIFFGSATQCQMALNHCFCTATQCQTAPSLGVGTATQCQAALNLCLAQLTFDCNCDRDKSSVCRHAPLTCSYHNTQPVYGRRVTTEASRKYGVIKVALSTPPKQHFAILHITSQMFMVISERSCRLPG